jgi:long-chain acyl-CoA synthetase
VSFLEQAAVAPSAIAIDDGERRTTRAELVDRVQRTGRLLRGDLGVGPGGHVSLLMGNRAEAVECVLAGQLAGLWVTPVNWHLTASEVAYILEDSGSTVLVTDELHEATAREAAAGRAEVVVAGAELDGLIATATDEPFDLDAPAGGSMLYTSGTTGRPKGVRRATSTSVAAALATSAAGGTLLGLDGGGPHLVTGPLYHAAPLGFAIPDLHNGGSLVIMPRWDPAETLRVIEAHDVRNSHLVPTMFVRLLRLPDDVRAAFDPSSLHVVLHGAAPISPKVKARMIDWWGPVLVEYWGSTEGGVFTLCSSKDWLEHPGTVGRAVTSYEVFAVDPAGEPLPAGEVGTLYTRHLVNPEVFEYHGAPEKTAEAHLAPATFTMGDIGHVDADGYVYLSDRAANVIISGGVNIYPAEVEQVLIEHPAVADVAVFGIPDEEWGEQVKAAVELAAGFEPSPALEASILAFAREHLAGFKVPRSVDFEDELPRHPTGKLYTRLLRDKYRQPS